MLRILITVLCSALIGVGLGQFQSFVMNTGFEERFEGARPTLAELRHGSSALPAKVEYGGTPKVEVDDGTEFDFGMMQHGETMSHRFTFRNVGDGPLKLEMGDSTCKCTVGELDTSLLQPGESTLVTLTWTAEVLTHEYRQTATIHTNDPNEDEVVLAVEGKIAHSFVIEPRSLVLGSISVTERVTESFHVFTYLKEPKELGDFIWTNEDTAELVRIEHERVEVDGEQFPQHKNATGAYKVTVHIRPGLPLGPLSTRIQFSTEHDDFSAKPKDAKLMELPVSGSVSGELTLLGGSSFEPKSNLVKLGTVRRSEGATVSIWLAIRGEHREETVPTIVSIEPEEALKVTIGEPSDRGDRRIFPIRFEVPKGAPEVYYPGNSSSSFGKVVIKTNHGLVQELPIHVRLIVKE